MDETNMVYMDANSKEVWDRIWDEEGGNTWRTYPCTYSKICQLIGTDKNVLEIGCGTGVLSYQIDQCGNNVFGVDMSEAAIKIRKFIYGLDGKVATIPPIPRLVNVDVIVASHILEHFKDPESIVKEMVAQCEEAIIAVPDDSLGPEECIFHYQKFNEESIKELLLKYYKTVDVYKITDISVHGKSNGIKLKVLVCKASGRK